MKLENTAIFYISSVEWDFIEQRPQFLSKAFAKLGATVFYTTLQTISQKISFEPVLNENGIFLVNLPYSGFNESIREHGKSIPYFAPVGNKEISTNAVAEKLSSYDRIIIWVNHPYVVDFLLSMLEILKKKVILVYDVVDYFQEFPSTQKFREAFDYCHDTLLDASNYICVVTESLKKTFPQYIQEKDDKYHNICLLPNACNWFSLTEEMDNNRKENTVGYLGAIAEWIDTEAIRSIAEAGINVEIIGPILPDSKETFNLLTLDHPNIKYFSRMSNEKALKQAVTWRCGLIPFKSSALTHYANPIKFYEYCCLGLPIVSTPLRGTGEITNGQSPLSPVFVNKIDAWPFYVKKAMMDDSKSSRGYRNGWASIHTWDYRAEEILRRITNDCFSDVADSSLD